MSVTAVDRPALIRRGKTLEYVTVGYNSVEGIIAVASGLMAGSIALVGFGFDSFIEVLSGAILLWRLYADVNENQREQVEQRALRLVGISFMVLAGYVAYDAVKSLIRREAPDESTVGIVLAAVSLVVMPLLVRAKRRVARSIGSAALEADAMQTQLCTYLSAILLAGLVLNATVGWWWADPVAALIMVPIIVNEGWEALRGEHCDDCHPRLRATTARPSLLVRDDEEHPQPLLDRVTHHTKRTELLLVGSARRSGVLEAPVNPLRCPREKSGNSRSRDRKR